MGGYGSGLDIAIRGQHNCLRKTIKLQCVRCGAAGSDGLVREFEFLAPTVVTLLTERRRCQPWGLQGAAGTAGDNRYNGKLLPGKIALNVREGEQLTVATPGGGGWGRANE
jgi:N-methylhydantoinase B